MSTVTDHLNEETADDVVCVTVNAHQVADLIPTLQVSKAKAIQFMFVTGGECTGLIDLLVAEARQQGVSPTNIDAVLALRPTTAPQQSRRDADSAVR
jgi:peroxiredoxin